MSDSPSPPGQPLPIAPDRMPLPRWTAPVFLFFAVALVPWIVWLGITLPRRQVTHHYDVTWVGFDVGLLFALLTLMWLAQHRSTYVEVAASVAGTMLVVDAWFDITSASGRTQLLEAVASAVLVELPIAWLCWWLARNAEAVRRRQHASLLYHAMRR